MLWRTGIVHLKTKILSLFTHPGDLVSVETQRDVRQDDVVLFSMVKVNED